MQVDPLVAMVAFSLKCKSSPIFSLKPRQKAEAKDACFCVNVCACSWTWFISKRTGRTLKKLIYKIASQTCFYTPILLTSRLAIICLLRSRQQTEHVGKRRRGTWKLTALMNLVM